jgi:hypothetical protein
MKTRMPEASRFRVVSVIKIPGTENYRIHYTPFSAPLPTAPMESDCGYMVWAGKEITGLYFYGLKNPYPFVARSHGSDSFSIEVPLRAN